MILSKAKSVIQINVDVVRRLIGRYAKENQIKPRVLVIDIGQWV